MNILSFVTVCYLVALVRILNAEHYCIMKSCKMKWHIACNNRGSFRRGCPKDSHLIDMGVYRESFLKGLNGIRNKVAGGEVWGLPKAARMATFKWCWELEQFAKMNVYKCKKSRDKCRNTALFHNVGQYVLERKFAEDLSDEKTLKDQIEYFQIGVEFLKERQIKKFGFESDDWNGIIYLVLTEYIDYIGCAAIRYTRDHLNNWLFACNFSNSNFLDLPVYRNASKAGSECKTGKNPDFPNLCSTSEKYDLNVEIALNIKSKN